MIRHSSSVLLLVFCKDHHDANIKSETGEGGNDDEDGLKDHVSYFTVSRAGE